MLSWPQIEKRKEKKKAEKRKKKTSSVSIATESSLVLPKMV